MAAAEAASRDRGVLESAGPPKAGSGAGAGAGAGIGGDNVDGDLVSREREPWRSRKHQYEVIASASGQASGAPSANGSQDGLGARLQALPCVDVCTAPALGDLLAYRTVELCEETWEPKLSGWRFATVTAVGGSGASALLTLGRTSPERVASYVGAAVDGSVEPLGEGEEGEQSTLPRSAMGELRLIHGQTFARVGCEAAGAAAPAVAAPDASQAAVAGAAGGPEAAEASAGSALAPVPARRQRGGRKQKGRQAAVLRMRSMSAALRYLQQQQ